MATILGDAKIKLTLDVEAAKQQLESLSERGVNLRDRSGSKIEESPVQPAKPGGGSTSPTSKTSTKSPSLGHAFKLARAMAYGNPALVNAPPLSPGMNPMQIQARIHAARAAVAALKHKHGLPATAPSPMQQFVSNFSAGKALIMGAKAFVAAQAVKAVIAAVEASPKVTAAAKGLAPGAATGAVDAFASHVSDQITGLRAKFTSFGKAAAEEKALAAAALRLGQHIPLGGAVDLFHFLQHQNEREEKMRLRVDKELDREVMYRLGQSIRTSIHR